MIRLLIVDDLRSVREILTHTLEIEPDIEIVGTASDGETAIEKVELLHPDVVLMDLEMPKMDGLTATQIISERFSQTKVLILTVHDREEYLHRVLQIGARGYLLKAGPQAELIQAIRCASQGYFQLSLSLLDKYIFKVVELQSTINELTSLKEVIQIQLEKTKIVSQTSLEKCLEIEQQIPKDRRKLIAYCQDLKTEQDCQIERMDGKVARVKKELSNMRKAFWGLMAIFFAMLSFSITWVSFIWWKIS
jgi:DNA-binding NarL/FixJ family response regulator